MEAIVQHWARVKTWQQQIGLNPVGIVREPIRLTHLPDKCWTYQYTRRTDCDQPASITITPVQAEKARNMLNPTMTGTCNHPPACDHAWFDVTTYADSWNGNQVEHCIHCGKNQTTKQGN